MAFFDNLVTAAQERRDAASFMSGSAFVKFCEVALAFSQRVGVFIGCGLFFRLTPWQGDNVSGRNRIVLFIKAADPGSGTQCSLGNDWHSVQLCATLSQGTTLLEPFPSCGEGEQ